jgi:hypothetical protein
MVEQPPLEKEIATPTGRKLWSVTLGAAGLLAVLTIIFLLVGKHIGLPH